MFQRATIATAVVIFSSIAQVHCTPSSVEPDAEETSEERPVTTDNTQTLIGIIAILAIAVVVLALALVFLIRSGRYTQNRICDIDLLPTQSSQANSQPPHEPWRSRALSINSGKQCKADSAHLVVAGYQPDYQPEYPPMPHDIELGTAVSENGTAVTVDPRV
mmetsp:Transcript_16958/g.40990  ORF Transcript_16958/g.40990 Transcript_16958/m.40990 type:complete len:162 (-) Transcript_16958:406-891(-)